MTCLCIDLALGILRACLCIDLAVGILGLVCITVLNICDDLFHTLFSVALKIKGRII